MKKIILKNKESIDISEKEFLDVLGFINEKKGFFIPRIQKYVNAFEVETIGAIDNQLTYGKPYKLFSEKDGRFRPERYFLKQDVGQDIADVITIPSQENMKVIVVGRYEDLENFLLSEDDYLDEQAKKSMARYPNNLLVAPKKALPSKSNG